MKLTRSERVCVGVRRIGNWIALAVAMTLGAMAAAQGVSTTTVQGTVYLANGQPGGGTLVLSWPAFTTSAGQAIAADQMTVTIPANGFVSVNLAPNQGAMPAGEYYTAVFYMSDGSSNTEYWVVPAAAQATIAQVRAQVMPAAQALQAVNKAYVDQSIAEVQQSLLSASGGNLSGPLYLNGDPTQPSQAADKHYVDTQVATALPLSGGSMTGPLTLSADPAQPMQAADKEYVDASAANAWPAMVLRVDEFAGADFGAKLQACVNAVSTSSGGTCDARNFTGSQTMSAGVTISTANTTVLLPCAQIATAAQIVITAGARNVALRGCALRGGSAASGSQGGTALSYSGSAALIQVGDSTYAVDTPGFHLDNVAISTTASTSATAQGLVAYRTQELDIESVYFLGNANQTGMTLDGTGNYTGGTFLDDQFDGFQTAVNAIGHQVANPATTDWMNASSFVRLHIDCPTSGGNPIAGTYGVNLQKGDGNTFTGGDVEGCATALHLGANAQNNTIVGLRNENSTNQVVADTGSSYNNWITGGTMFTGQLTDNGTRNSFQDTFHRSFNALNGDWYGSQQDATLTNHFRLGIGNGNERGLLNRYQTDSGYRWTMGLSDATGGEQFYQVLDELNNVYRLSVGQYNPGQSSTNDQTVINSAGTGAVVLNGSNNAGTGGVVVGSGGTSAATVATISNAGNAQFNGTLQAGGTAQFAGTATVRNNADAEVDYYLWPGLTTSQKGSFTYKDWNGNSQWYMLKDASNNWALNSAVGGLDSFKAYQSTNSGDTYVNASNASGAVRVNYESGSGSAFKVYGGNSSTLYASFTGATSIEFPGLAAGSGHYCLQIDTSGYVTNTGAACGSGSGSGGSGTVNSSNAGYIAYYTAAGTVLGGISSVPVTAGGTGATSAAGALSSLGAVPVSGGTMSGALNSTYSGTNSFTGSLAAGAALQAPTYEGSAPPVLDIRNPHFAGGAVCDGTTSHPIDAALQAALNSMTTYVGGVIQIVGSPSSCYLANPTLLTWPNAPVVLKIQGQLMLGTTLATQADLIGNSGALCADFQPASNQCASISLASGGMSGTLGTAVAVPSMPTTGTSVTFTPSTMAGLYKGTAITVVDQLSCAISSISQPVSGTATAVMSGSCHIPDGVPITVAGVANSAYNGSYSFSGGSPHNFFVTHSDYVKNTISFNLAGSASPSAGGTITGLNEDTVENVLITATTSTTATAEFFRPHTASATWGVVTVYVSNPASTSPLPNNSAGNTIKNINIQSNASGYTLWEQGYNSQLDSVGVTSVGACSTNPLQQASFAVDLGSSSFMHVRDSSFITGCQPWAVHIGEQYQSYGSEGGAIHMDNVSLLNGGVKLDYGGTVLDIDRAICEECARGMVTWDPSNFWSGTSQVISIDHSLLQDNPENLMQCWASYLYPASAPLTIQHSSFGQCVVNDYVEGQVKTDSVLPSGNSAQRGVVGVRNDGKTVDAEITGEGANFAPSIIPYATLPVNAMSGWGCTSTSAKAPDGSSTACEFNNGTSSNYIQVGYAGSLTPAVGDQILFCTWVYSPTPGAAAVVLGTNSALVVGTINSTHFYISPDGTAYSQGNGAGATYWDSEVVNAPWHPVCGWAVVTQSDGTSGQAISLYLGSNSSNALEYWDPSWMYIPASAGYSQAEVMRWRAQLLHGYVPSGAPALTLSVDPNLTLAATTASTAASAASAISAGQLNGGSIPASAALLGTNSSSQPVAATAHNESVPRNCTTTNSGNAYTCSTSPTFTPAAGDSITVNFNAANSAGAATLAVNGGSAATIYKNVTISTLLAGDIQANHWTSLIYDSSGHWQIEGQLGNAYDPVLSGTSSSFGGSSLSAHACTTTTVSIPGATTSMGVTVTPQGNPSSSGYFNWYGYVSATGTVTVELCNQYTSSATPTAELYNVRVIE